MLELRTKARPAVRERLQRALEAVPGDTADAAEYTDAQWEQARVESRAAELEGLLADAKAVEPSAARGLAGLGSTVVIRNGERTEWYTLVAPAESDPRRGRVSADSPVGPALVGRRPGEVVAVDTPAGRRRWHIVDIE